MVVVVIFLDPKGHLEYTKNLGPWVDSGLK